MYVIQKGGAVKRYFVGYDIVTGDEIWTRDINRAELLLKSNNALFGTSVGKIFADTDETVIEVEVKSVISPVVIV